MIVAGMVLDVELRESEVTRMLVSKSHLQSLFKIRLLQVLAMKEEPIYSYSVSH